MIRGWWIGDFAPSVLRTNQFEAAFIRHHAGDHWPAHYQRIATEYNLLITGTMSITINNTVYELTAEDIFIIAPGEIAVPTFHTNCDLMVIKVPSLPTDKVLA